MPANFTEEERKEIKERLIVLGYDLIREMGLKKMKVSTIAERADIATGTFYHDYAFHWKWFFLGLLLSLPLALLLGGIVALIGVIV